MRPSPPRLAVVALTLVAALALVGCGSSESGSPSGPTFTAQISDAASIEQFYAPPAVTPQAPGLLIRAARIDTSITGARAWRVMFSSTATPTGMVTGGSTIETGLVLIPTRADGPHPVAVWGHPTTGITPACAPSRQTRPEGNIVGAQALVDAGWIVAAPDYEGLGIDGLGPHPYLIGASLGRSMLDIVRAVDGLPDADRGTDLVAYGHSEGGQAALFAGQMARSYAPELNLTAVAAMAPSGELDQIFREDHSTVTGALLGGYLGGSWSKWFAASDPSAPVDQGFSTESLFDRASWRLADQMAAACSVGEPSVLPLWGQVQAAVDSGTFWRRNPGVDAPWSVKLAENSAGQEPIPAPVLLTVGTADDIVSPAAVDATEARYRDNGTSVTMRRFPGGDHMSGVDLALAEVLEFLQNPPR